ncbi:MAG: SAM-dependent methyltransferase [Clostridia bacterium]|nr:SAM-dependent methyltransferase [Clostridia bacterium]
MGKTFSGVREDVISRTAELISSLVREQTIKKIVFSRPFSPEDGVKCEGRLVRLKGIINLQLETFYPDGRNSHDNVRPDETAVKIAEYIGRYRQCNVVTPAGDAEYAVSKNGKYVLMNGIKSAASSVPGEVFAHDREKRHVLYDGRVYPFLVLLGVSDRDGKVFDRKRAKFRQIDRFLGYVSEIYDRLPRDGELYLLDLCCGKSYLSFAVYWYLTEVRGREVLMDCADLKRDVIDFCAGCAEELGYRGMRFRCTDIEEFVPGREPDLVLSLHACDTATDVVLTAAARYGAKVILSTPCCQHQVNGQLSRDSELGRALLPVLEHSMLKQKLAVAITDALRCKRLRASGYSVDVTELTDPEDTPKNLLIRAVRIKMTDAEKEKYRREFDEMSRYCGVDIYPGKTEGKQK